MVLIYIDLEKASGTTWKYRIMNDLYDMPLLIQKFLSERRFRVRVETSLSDDYEFGELPRVAFYLSPYSFIRSTASPAV